MEATANMKAGEGKVKESRKTSTQIAVIKLSSMVHFE